MLDGYSFDQACIFTKYIEDLYHVKLNAKGSERWIAKLLLNCLYGVFGRRKDTLPALWGWVERILKTLFRLLQCFSLT